jgi:hypothetical protein
MTKTTANLFFCVNDSDSWLIALGDKYIVCDSREHALSIWGLVDNIEDSPFGSMRMIEPREVCKQYAGSVATVAIQSFARRVNADYVSKRIARWLASPVGRHPSAFGTMVPLHERISNARRFEGIFFAPRPLRDLLDNVRSHF